MLSLIQAFAPAFHAITVLSFILSHSEPCRADGKPQSLSPEMVLRQTDQALQQPFVDQTCFNITQENTPDPWITYANGKFYFTFTANNRIPLWEADSLIDFWDRPTRGAIWIPPPNASHSDRLWAPELHAIDGRWYIYYAAQHPELGNRSHRLYVLGGPPSTFNPHVQSEWTFLGPIRNMDQRQWAIDGTTFRLDHKLYLVYSGWLTPPECPWDDYSEATQQLYILELADPITAVSGRASVMISAPTYDWERLGPVGINEGPQWLEQPVSSDGASVSHENKWRGLVYSCGPSWTRHYKLATLQLTNGRDPLDPKSWIKSPAPLLQTATAHNDGPFGPGHASFLHMQDGNTYALFHATDRRNDGNQGRKCRMQKLTWTQNGPYMNQFVGRSDLADVLRMKPPA